MPRRARDRRHNPLSALAAHVTRAAGGPCIATIIPLDSDDPEGAVGLLLMACPPTSACARCNDARARLRPWPAPPAPAVEADEDF